MRGVGVEKRSAPLTTEFVNSWHTSFSADNVVSKVTVH